MIHLMDLTFTICFTRNLFRLKQDTDRVLDINKDELFFDRLDDTGDQIIFLILVFIIDSLLFVFFDPLFEHLLGNVDGSTADLLEIDFFFNNVTNFSIRIEF